MEYGETGHFYMVDCGIMDTDENPYPSVTEEQLQNTDYIFLTHCHKDHSGAFTEFVKRGFHGTLVASSMTIRLSGIHYEKCLVLPSESSGEDCLPLPGGELSVRFGRTGHCPGGVWLLIHDMRGECFFSGDYQENALTYACDAVSGLSAGLAVIDCAHNETFENADDLRKEILSKTKEFLNEGRKVIFPVPQYGRGLEILMMLKTDFPGEKILADTGFVQSMEQSLSEPGWYRRKAYGTLICLLNEMRYSCIDFAGENSCTGNLSSEDENAAKMRENAVCGEHRVTEEYDILFLADTHLKKPCHARFVQKEIENGARLIVTGRVKKGEMPEHLISTGEAVRILYPHHQSRGDLYKMAEENDFQVILPFHNDEKELFFSPF